MKTLSLIFLGIGCVFWLHAAPPESAPGSTEEILSTQPVVIAPKRIETASPAVFARSAEATESEILINPQNVLFKIEFKRGSIRLSNEMRSQLRKSGLTAGQKIRISGFADAPENKGKQAARKKAEAVRLANLRARVVASFLAEYIGGIHTELQWNSNAPAGYTESLAVIERVD